MSATADSFDSADGRTYSTYSGPATEQAPRDLQGERDHETREARCLNPDCGVTRTGTLEALRHFKRLHDSPSGLHKVEIGEPRGEQPEGPRE